MNTYDAPDPAYGETQAAKAPEARIVLEQLDKEMYRLEEEIKSLAARLAPVSLPEMQTPRDKVSRDANGRPHSEMYLHIESLRFRLTDANIYLSNLLQRLEI